MVEKFESFSLVFVPPCLRFACWSKRVNFDLLKSFLSVDFIMHPALLSYLFPVSVFVVLGSCQNFLSIALVVFFPLVWVAFSIPPSSFSGFLWVCLSVCLKIFFPIFDWVRLLPALKALIVANQSHALTVAKVMLTWAKMSKFVLGFVKDESRIWTRRIDFCLDFFRSFIGFSYHEGELDEGSNQKTQERDSHSQLLGLLLSIA